MLPHAYEHAAVIRQAWDDAGVHPRDIKSLADFRERAPFVDKRRAAPFPRRARRPLRRDSVRSRPDELTAVMSTSGTTGDPTLVPEKWGGGGGRPTIITATSGAWACDPATTSRSCCSRSAGRRTACSKAWARCPSSSTSTRPRWTRFCDLSLRYRPTGLYNFGSVLINAVREACERRGFDPATCSSSYKGVVFAGEPLSPRARTLAESLGRQLFEHTRRRRRHRRVRMPRARRPALLGGHRADRGPRSRRHRRSGRRRTLRARRDVAVQRTAPLIRYRSDDIVRITRDRLPVRAHARAGVADRPQG